MVSVATSSTSLSSLLSFRSGFAINCNLSSYPSTTACVFQEKTKKGDKYVEVERTESVVKEKVVIQESTARKPQPPLINALKASAEEKVASFHFPGHNRGLAAPVSLTNLIGIKPFIYDLPDLPELEVPILKAQKQAAELFGSSETWFLVGGTTCGIQAAIMATCSPGEYIILARNSHLSAISGILLSGAIPKYILPEYDNEWDIAGGVTACQIEKTIKELEMDGRQPSAVFITSPTYHGICSNLSEICKLCHSRNIPVIVDEAHGAHFGFHPQLPQSALQQGADVAVQSTHKVLSSLTQSSMLHLSGNIVDRDNISRCLQTLQSTSPSNLLLASLDAATTQLSKNPQTIFNQAIDLATEVRTSINKIPGVSSLDIRNCPCFEIDPLRLTVGFWQLGLSGFEADEILYRNQKVVCELVGTRSITFAINLGTCQEHAIRLVRGLELLSTNAENSMQNDKLEKSVVVPFGDMSLTPRDAFFARKRKVRVEESVGKVCGELICPYPPGIPVMYPGEVITNEALEYVMDLKDKGATISGASDPLLSCILVCDC